MHTQFIGEVIDTKVDEGFVGDGEVVDVEQLNPIMFMPDSRLYYGLGALVGKAYTIGKGLGQQGHDRETAGDGVIPVTLPACASMRPDRRWWTRHD